MFLKSTHSVLGHLSVRCLTVAWHKLPGAAAVLINELHGGSGGGSLPGLGDVPPVTNHLGTACPSGETLLNGRGKWGLNLHPPRLWLGCSVGGCFWGNEKWDAQLFREVVAHSPPMGAVHEGRQKVLGGSLWSLWGSLSSLKYGVAKAAWSGPQQGVPGGNSPCSYLIWTALWG